MTTPASTAPLNRLAIAGLIVLVAVFVLPGLRQRLWQTGFFNG